uniref:amidase n=1 Tax=uncultured Rhizobium sp. TaxID=155567 RepID=UPI002607E7C5|nr:amidase [uncultured Rhizobium sp.]
MADQKARQIVDAALANIATCNGDIHALIHVDPYVARSQADDLDHGGIFGGPLFGETFVVKDLIDVAHQPTQAGSRLFGNRPAEQDASCVSSLKAAGAIVLGKANMHELAVGGAVNPWFGQVINPLSRAHGTGGTSSGSAAAVASGLCSFALGTDSGGSNRSVAAACGLFGYKPTHDTIVSSGIMPTAPSMDSVGVIANTAEMISTCWRVLTDEKKSASGESLQGRTFARIDNLLSSPVDGTVSDAWALAFTTIAGLGGRVVALEVQAPQALAKAGVVILRHEFAELYGEKIDRSADRVGPAVHAFLAASRQISGAQFEDAKALRAEHQARWASMLADVDGFLSPTAPGLAPDLADEMTAVGATRVAYGAAGAEFRMWANTIGIPAVAIPVQPTKGLPASVQLAGAMHTDGLLLDLAAALGRAMTEKIAA